MPMDGLERGLPAVRRAWAAGPARGPAVVALLLGGCFDPQLLADTDADTLGAATDAGSTGATAGSATTAADGPAGATGDGPDATTTTTGGGEATAGEADAGDDTDTRGGDEPAPPTIDAFTVSETSLHAAGPLTFTLECSADVVSVELTDEDQGPLAALTPADFPYTHIITGDEYNDHGRFRAIVYNAGGASAASPVREVDIGLPPAGMEVWTAAYGDLPSAALGVIPYQGGAVVVGYELDGLHLRARVRRYDDEGKQRWVITPEVSVGYAAAVAVDADDHLVVVGNRHVMNYQAMWIRTFDSEGEEVPGTAINGSYGERGLAIATAPGGGFYVAGDVREGGQPTCHDLRLTSFVAGEPPVTKTWGGVNEADKPCIDDQGLAIAVLEDGDVAVAGVTGVYDLVDGVPVARPRLLALRYTAGGALLGAFVDDDDPYVESQGWSVASDRAGGLLVGGRVGPRITTLAFPVVHRLDGAMQERWFRILPGGGFPGAGVDGVGASLTGGVVVAATVAGAYADTDVLVGELDRDTGASWLWKEAIDVYALDDRVHHLALGPYGHLYVAGAATLAAGPRALLRKVSP